MNPHDLIDVRVGQAWVLPLTDDVYRVTQIYPAIEGYGSVSFTIEDLNTGRTCVVYKRDFSYFSLKLLEEKDVPMALLAGAGVGC